MADVRDFLAAKGLGEAFGQVVGGGQFCMYLLFGHFAERVSRFLVSSSRRRPVRTTRLCPHGYRGHKPEMADVRDFLAAKGLGEAFGQVVGGGQFSR
jgi:SAM-dependent MidA family methyltransferase